MTVLDPDGWIAGMPVESLLIQLGRKLPLPRISSAIGESENLRLLSSKTKARSNAVQYHCAPKQIGRLRDSLDLQTRSGAQESPNDLPPSGRTAWCRRCCGFDTERGHRGLTDLAGRRESVLQRGDFGLQCRSRCRALLLSPFRPRGRFLQRGNFAPRLALHALESGLALRKSCLQL